MTFVGIVGILLALGAASIAFVQQTKLRLAVFVAAFLLHVAAAFAFYQFVQAESADTALYYFDPMAYYEQFGFGISTYFVIYFVQALRGLVGGTYLDYFLLFQAFGFWGVALMMRTFQEIYAELNVEQPPATNLFLLIPSLHWWTSAIGKDAPFMLAIVLSIWAAMRFRKRIHWFVLALVAIFVLRPHLGLLVSAALFVTIVVERRIAFWLRGLLVLGALFGVYFAIATIQTTFNVDLTDPESVSNMLEIRDNVLNTADAGDSRVDAGYPFRVMSLLFRPLFYDVDNMFGNLASIENVLVLMVFGYLLFRIKRLMALFMSVAFVRFAVLMSLLLIGFQGLAYYNVGLGLRQKWSMILPMVFVIAIAVSAFVRATRRVSVREEDFSISPTRQRDLRLAEAGPSKGMT